MQKAVRHWRTGDVVAYHRESGHIAPHFGPVPETVPWIAPSFFDLQINGGAGIGFSSPEITEAGVSQVIALCRQHGIGGLLPTLITNSFAILQHGFQTLERARENDAAVAAAVPGYHLEGPYISTADGPRGAHPLEHVRPPDWSELARLQDAAGGRIRLLTLSPEYPESLAFIERAVATGMTIAIGHTAARPEQIREAIAAGAKLSTHLGNGCHAELPRHENYLWEQLAADELWTSLISDGHHLPASLLKCFTRVKGVEKCIITCDASSLAGMPPGRYRQWGKELEVLPSGKVIVPNTPFLAGSGDFTDTCVSRMTQLAGVPLADAIAMATINPRRLLELPLQTRNWICFDWQPGGAIRILEWLDIDCE